MRRWYRGPKSEVTSTELGGYTPKKRYRDKGAHRDPKPIPGFYGTPAWRELRKKVFKRFGKRCMACGNLPKEKYNICVDHIEPRSKRPDLELDINNLQVLCRPCNDRKSNKHSTNYRTDTMWFAHFSPEEISIAIQAVKDHRQKTKPE